MLERTLEIALSRYPQMIDPDWTLVGQQLATGAGILDLLFRDKRGDLHLVEVKKGPATIGAITQVLSYVARYGAEGRAALPWVVAHSIPKTVADHAQRVGVRTRAISMAEVEAFLARKGTSVNELVPLRRRTPGALTGGAGDLWKEVDTEAIYGEISSDVAAVFKDLAARGDCTLKTGAMQTTIWYRGVKLGGFNRKHRGGVGYITSGVLTLQARSKLEQIGFSWMEKGQAAKSHVHTWMEIPGRNAAGFRRGLEIVRQRVDEQLGQV